MDDSLRKFIEEMPKIELHLHIEGTLEPELMFKLAKRNGVTLPFKTIEEAKEARREYKNLDDFLKSYYAGMSVLQTPEDFKELTYTYLEKAHSQNVTHVEIFFDPQGHTERGVVFDTVIKGITDALKKGEKELGISSKLIMCFLRHLPEEASPGKREYKDAFETLKEAKSYIEQGLIHGIGLDSSESPFPPTLFKNVFAEAKKLSPTLKLVAHAGEEGPSGFVRDALDILKIDRIDHGNHALDDDALVNRLAHDKIGLTVCPYSNLRLCHTLDLATGTKLKDLKDHRLKDMLDKKLMATINSDDPAYFRTDENEGAYITENLLVIADKLNLTKTDIITLANNAIDISFLSESEKEQKRRELRN